MKKLINFIACLGIISVAFGFTGCKPAEVEEDNDNGVGGYDIPAWYMNVENTDTAIFATGSAQYNGDLEMAKLGAESAARRAMGAILETKIQSVFTKYAAQINDGETTVNESMMQEATRAIVNGTQNGVSIDKTHLGDQNGDGKPDTFFARAVLTTEVLTAQLHDQASAKIERVRENAAEAFQELDRLLAEEVKAN
ncbi:MAG: hypothetical protein NUW37_07690 [Planctomycetes bacterium]|nr:hypothetical protein [Planctomycetota bacterium]